MEVTPLSQAQWIKVFKGIGYSFVSAAIAALIATNGDISKKALIAVLVAGTNGILVFLKQLFTTEQSS